MAHHYLRGIHRQYSDRDIVWHESPTAFYFQADRQVTIEEVLHESEMDSMEIVKSELYDRWGDAVANRFVLYAEAPWMDGRTCLGRVVGNRYDPLQITEMAERLEGLQQHWPLEGAMFLKDGKISIVQLKLDEFYVGDREEEKHLSYLTVADDHTQGGVMWLETDIRAVCWNTYSASIQALAKLRIPHSGNTDTVLAFLAKVQEKTIEEQKTRVHLLNQMFTRKINKEEFATVVDAAFPLPQNTTRMDLAAESVAQEVTGDVADAFFELVQKDKAVVDNKTERAKKLQLAAGANYAKFNDEHPYAANTLYAAWNGGITETIDYSPLFTGSAEKREVAAMVGRTAKFKEDAWNAAVGLL
jgi:hypothetical protein